MTDSPCPCNDPASDVPHSTGRAHTLGMNTATTRTDAHRPSAIVAADYRFVDVLDLQAETWHPAERELLEETERRYVGDHAQTWRCSVCGTGIRYACVWEHIPTGGYVVTGQDCADSISTIAASEAARRVGVLSAAAAELRHERRIVRRREEWAAEAPENAAAILTLGRLADVEDAFVQSLRSQLRRKGELSGRQVEVVATLESKIGARLERAAERAARDARSQHIGQVGERLTLTLRLLNSPEGRDSDWGTTYTHLLADADDNIFVWYASTGSSPWRDEDVWEAVDGYMTRTREGFGWTRGSAVTVAATVKKHVDRDGKRSTVLTRVSLPPARKSRAAK